MSGLLVCSSCFGLRGDLNLRRQLCSCAPLAEHDALAEARFAREGTYWTQVAEICYCCGAELVDASHKFTRWFCHGCFRRADHVNRAFGRCAVPVGAHSIVNSVYVNIENLRTSAGASAEADQLNAFYRETSSVFEWSRQVVERQWQRAGLPPGHDVAVDDYLEAVWRRRVDKALLFEELATARGVPPLYWPESDAIKLDLVWKEDRKSACIFFSSDKILWERADSPEEYTDLLLQVERGHDRKWRWEASISPQAAGKVHHVLTNGIAPSLDQAKVDCETAAIRLMLDQEQRYGSTLTSLGSDGLEE